MSLDVLNLHSEIVIPKRKLLFLNNKNDSNETDNDYSLCETSESKSQVRVVTFPNAIIYTNQGMKKISYTQLDDLYHPNYQLKKPLEVKFIQEGSELIGEIEILALYSFGEDKFSILKDLISDVIELFEDITKMDDNQLGKYPRKWKDILKNYINKI